MTKYMINNAHIEETKVGFSGTPQTASISAMKEMRQSRKDELESLAYNFMFLIDFEMVPWVTDQTRDSILEKKIEFVSAQTETTPLKFQQVQKFVKSAQQLKFEEEPDYAYFRSLIEKLMVP